MKVGKTLHCLKIVIVIFFIIMFLNYFGAPQLKKFLARESMFVESFREVDIMKIWRKSATTTAEFQTILQNVSLKTQMTSTIQSLIFLTIKPRSPFSNHGKRLLQFHTGVESTLQGNLSFIQMITICYSNSKMIVNVVICLIFMIKIFMLKVMSSWWISKEWIYFWTNVKRWLWQWGKIFLPVRIWGFVYNWCFIFLPTFSGFEIVDKVWRRINSEWIAVNWKQNRVLEKLWIFCLLKVWYKKDQIVKKSIGNVAFC